MPQDLRPAPNRRTRPRASRRRRGFTLVEMMFATAISGLVMAALASVIYLAARASKDLFAQVHTRSARSKALDAIRYRLMDGRVGSCSVTNSGHRIEFVDPSLGGVTSALYFNEVTDELYYDDDIDDATAGTVQVKGPIDITFELLSSGAIVRLQVKTAAMMSYREIDTEQGSTSVYLRNV